MDVGLARLETARRRVLASRAVAAAPRRLEHRRVALAAEPTHRLRMSQEVRSSTVSAAAQDGATDSEALPVLPMDAATAAPDGRETGR